MTGSDAARHVRRFDAQSLAQRARQLERFNEWERRQAWADQANSTDSDDAAAVRRVLAWYGDALDFATRHGSAGPGAREAHLEHLIEWMRRWRAAWRLE